MNKTKNFEGKKILFLAPAFFGYEYKIKETLEQMGALVDFYDERSVINAFDRALLKLVPMIFETRTKTYYKKILNKNYDKQYDYVFVVKCDMITEKILQEFRCVYKNAVFCLYLWDSIKNVKGINEKFKYFDRILSFDKNDADNNLFIKFRPLFYSDDFKKDIKDSNNYKYDISFCGTIHSDRYKVIKDITNICLKLNLEMYTFCYLQSKFIYYYYKIMKREFRHVKKTFFNYEKLSSKTISDIVDDSRIILDIQHPKQTGLTIRTIEMIGMNKKLITTNIDIKNYDFYNSNNILVINRKKVEIPESFLLSDYEVINESVYQKYSIHAWLNDILISN